MFQSEAASIFVVANHTFIIMDKLINKKKIIIIIIIINIIN